MAKVTPAFTETVSAAVERLEALGVRYMLTGGVVLPVYGVARMTGDVDIEVAFGDEAQRKAFERGFILEDEGRDVFGQATRIYHVPLNPVLLELFLASAPFPLRALGRRRRHRFATLEREAWIIAPEDLLVMKAVHAENPTRPRWKSAQDLGDIEGIVASQRPSLDVALVRREAEDLGVLDVLRPWA